MADTTGPVRALEATPKAPVRTNVGTVIAVVGSAMVLSAAVAHLDMKVGILVDTVADLSSTSKEMHDAMLYQHLLPAAAGGYQPGTPAILGPASGSHILTRPLQPGGTSP